MPITSTCSRHAIYAGRESCASRDGMDLSRTGALTGTAGQNLSVLHAQRMTLVMQPQVYDHRDVLSFSGLDASRRDLKCRS